MNMTPEQRREIAAKAHESATEQAKKLRDQTVDVLRTRLASAFDVRPYDKKEGYFGVTVKRHQCAWFTYTLSFRVNNRSRYFTSMPHFKCEIVGTRYERNRRSFTPLYEVDKKGQYNFVRMAEDVERAFEAERIRHERNESMSKRVAYSASEFTKVCERTGLAPCSYAGTYGEATVGKYRVTVSAGDYGDGKVKVTVTPLKQFLSAEEAVALIEGLKHA